MIPLWNAIKIILSVIFNFIVLIIPALIPTIHANLDLMWDKIDLVSNRILKKEKYAWEFQHIEKIVEELIELKVNAKMENNPMLYNQLRTSLIRAHKVQNELESSIKK